MPSGKVEFAIYRFDPVSYRVFKPAYVMGEPNSTEPEAVQAAPESRFDPQDPLKGAYRRYSYALKAWDDIPEGMVTILEVPDGQKKRYLAGYKRGGNFTVYQDTNNYYTSQDAAVKALHQGRFIDGLQGTDTQVQSLLPGDRVTQFYVPSRASVNNKMNQEPGR